MQFDLKTKASPEQVLRARTDFTDARLRTWNHTLDPKTYEVITSQRATQRIQRQPSPAVTHWTTS